MTPNIKLPAGYPFGLMVKTAAGRTIWELHASADSVAEQWRHLTKSDRIRHAYCYALNARTGAVLNRLKELEVPQ